MVNVKVNADATVRGCNGNVGFMVSTFSDLIFRVGLVYVLTPFMGFAGVGWAWAIGWVLGYPSLRLKGVYLSLTTIGFSEIVRLVLTNWVELTGGTMGVRQ